MASQPKKTSAQKGKAKKASEDTMFNWMLTKSTTARPLVEGMFGVPGGDLHAKSPLITSPKDDKIDMGVNCEELASMRQAQNKPSSLKSRSAVLAKSVQRSVGLTRSPLFAAHAVRAELFIL